MNGNLSIIVVEMTKNYPEDELIMFPLVSFFLLIFGITGVLLFKSYLFSIILVMGAILSTIMIIFYPYMLAEFFKYKEEAWSFKFLRFIVRKIFLW